MLRINKTTLIIAATVIAVLILSSAGLKISGLIKEYSLQKAGIYHSAFQPRNSEEFARGANDNVGYTMASGAIIADNPVQTSHAEGEFISLEIIHQRYNMHIISDGDGSTKTSYDWDTVGLEKLAADSFTFCGVPGEVKNLSLSNRRIGTDQPNHYPRVEDERWIVIGVPQRIEVTIFADVRDGEILPIQGRIEVYENLTVSEVLAKKSFLSKVGQAMFGIIWIAITGFVAIGVSVKMTDVLPRSGITLLPRKNE